MIMESKKEDMIVDMAKLKRMQIRVFLLEKQNIGPNGLKANERVKKIISLIEAEVENDN